MINAKVAEKITAACSHSVPVLVPCGECVQKQLVAWEKRIREQCRAEMADEMKCAKESEAAALNEAKRMQGGHGLLLANSEALRRANAELLEKLREAKRQIEGLRAQLHAEQAVHNQPPIRMVSE